MKEDACSDPVATAFFVSPERIDNSAYLSDAMPEVQIPELL